MAEVVAVLRLPPARRDEIDVLMRITKAEVAEDVERSVAAVEEARLRWGPKAQVGAPSPPEQVRGTTQAAQKQA